MKQIKNRLKKSLFECINGVEIEKLKTSELLRQVKLLPVLFVIMVVCAIFIAAFGLLFAFAPDTDIAIFSLFFLGGAIISAFLAFIFPKRLKNVKQTLDTREITDDIRKSAENKINETKKYSMAGIIILAIVCIITVISFVGNVSDSKFADNQCHTCERKFTDSDNKMSIAKTNMCENCYNNYDSLKWVLEE